MDIKHLNTFITVNDLNSFTKAGVELGYAQSTITSHIKAIECEIEDKVFYRNGRKILLTETGKRILADAKKINKIYDNIKEQLSSDIEGTIKISGPESVLHYRFPRILSSFISKYPSIHFEIDHSNSQSIKTGLSKKKIDIAFLADIEQKNGDLIYKKIAQENPVLIYSSNYADFMMKELLDSQTILYTAKGCTYRRTFNTLLNHYQIKPSKTINIENIEMIKRLVTYGIGVSVLPIEAVKFELKAGLIKAKTIPTKHHIFTQIAYHKEFQLTPEILAFLSIINEKTEPTSLL